MARRHKLTTAGRTVIFLIVLALVAVVGFFGIKFLANGDGVTLPGSSDNGPKTTIGASKIDSNDETINLSLDEWIGWKPIIDANGGTSTASGSIFDQLGLKVNIHVINDAEASSNALIKGELNGAGYTTNRAAFLSGKFKDAGLDVVMPVFTNYSNGGDGIIATSKIKSVEDLVDAKIAVPKYSEAHTLVAWFVNKSDLTQEQKDKIINNLTLLDDPEQCGQAFFSGKVDVAATWQPYLSNAENSTDSHILFDTRASKTLIMDGIVFRKDWAEANQDTVTKFIEGILKANLSYTNNFDTIRAVLPMVADSSDEDIKSMCGDAELMNYASMEKTLNETAPMMFRDMCEIWTSLGETVDSSAADMMFDSKYLTPLKDQYSSIADKAETTTAKLSEEKKAETIDAAALMTKTSTVTFVPNTAKFMDNAEADESLRSFVEIAKVLDGTIIQIEGNINSRNGVEGGQELSESRAKTVANYFIANGIDAGRIITVGNDNRKMLVDPDAPNCEINRRTDVFFKVIEE